VNLTLFKIDDILKNEMWHPVCDELWFIICYLHVGKIGCYKKLYAFSKSTFRINKIIHFFKINFKQQYFFFLSDSEPRQIIVLIRHKENNLAARPCNSSTSSSNNNKFFPLQSNDEIRSFKSKILPRKFLVWLWCKSLRDNLLYFLYLKIKFRFFIFKKF